MMHSDSVETETLQQIEAHLRDVRRVAGLVSGAAIAQVSNVLAAARGRGASIFVFGNGGSAATASHLCSDLSAVDPDEGRRLRVQCLNSNTSILTAVANDRGYEHVFQQQLHGLVRRGDVVLGISGSGNSLNCIHALEYARQCQAVTVGVVGFDGGRMRQWCDIVVHVAHAEYFVVEDVHSIVCHAIARALRRGPLTRAHE